MSCPRYGKECLEYMCGSMDIRTGKCHEKPSQICSECVHWNKGYCEYLEINVEPNNHCEFYKLKAGGENDD